MELRELFTTTREQTLKLIDLLEVEDCCLQVASEQSPIKWHLGHTTWFFEELILKPYSKGHKAYADFFSEIFNSYYKSAGTYWPQENRGHLSRPTLKEVIAYREYVESQILKLLEKTVSDEIKNLIILGINHEEQHQELIHMDAKLVLSKQIPSIRFSNVSFPHLKQQQNNLIKFKEGLFEFGHSGDDFCYDNEIPRHKAYIHAFSLKSSMETSGEYLEFIEEGGYERPKYWYADGFNFVSKNSIAAPLYWRKKGTQWFEYTLFGEQELDLNSPVKHVSFYEAAAYARFRKMRLPTEFEWELASTDKPDDFKDLNLVLWQWTQSDYAPYPNHQWEEGPLGEYNSKFMVNLKVLRGGAFVTSRRHYRNTYRNYFLPDKRWMFSGIRLAGDYNV